MAKVPTFRPSGFNGLQLGGREGRGTSAKRGYGARWQKYSRRYRVAHPICVRCQVVAGRVTPSAHVDHIDCDTPPDAPAFWSAANHQPLCQPCHNVKTTAERQGKRFTPAQPFPDAPAPDGGPQNL